MSDERDQRPGRLPPAARGREPPDRRPDLRQGGMRAVGAAAARLAAPIVARRGGGVLARLKAAWAEVVGPELAAVSWPESLGRDGALKLRVAPAAALELQHRAPLVTDRINLFFGYQAVMRLMLVQGPLPLPPAPRSQPPPLTGAETAAIDAQLAAVTDPELRGALAELGRLMLRDGRRG